MSRPSLVCCLARLSLREPPWVKVRERTTAAILTIIVLAVYWMSTVRCWFSLHVRSTISQQPPTGLPAPVLSSLIHHAYLTCLSHLQPYLNLCFSTCTGSPEPAPATRRGPIPSYGGEAFPAQALPSLMDSRTSCVGSVSSPPPCLLSEVLNEHLLTEWTHGWNVSLNEATQTLVICRPVARVLQKSVHCVYFYLLKYFPFLD